ncbi:ATP-binding cassette sub-family C member 4-like isoform X2 [Onthophagus taurus]|uniref:ATP-binding cassette sub-family C member 4-like isoform X2 n=1 Tax=Onthophagus taurus TaxID=166361 RepID=UPI0039BDE030
MVEKINPQENANIFSKCTFTWFIPTIIKRYKQELSEKDLFTLLFNHQSNRLGDLLEHEWEKEKLKKSPSLWKVVIKIFGKSFLLYSTLSIATELVFKTLQCLSFIVLMKHFSQDDQSQNEKHKIHAFISAGILTFSSLAIIIGQHQFFIGKKLTALRRKTAKITDERIKMLNEIIFGIKTIKILAWEKPITFMLKQTRKKEIKYLRSTSIFLALLMSFMYFLPKLALFSSILTYSFIGNHLTPSYVFGLVASYNLLTMQLNKFFPQTLFRWGEAIVSVKRIEEFLQINEITKIEDTKITNYGITLKNVYSKWNENSKDNVLNDISLSITKPELVALIGNVGSGKSSFLKTILKENFIVGVIKVNGIISYCSQEPWLFKGTIKENILFEEPYNSKKYKKILKICALEHDLLTLFKGDEFKVVENGSNLSGGQKARINLARALYKDADIYLLDDILSSIDSQVAQFIFNECVKKFLRKKCVVLVLNQIEYLNYVDCVYVVQNGKLILKSHNEQNKSRLQINFAENNIKELSKEIKTPQEHLERWKFEGVKEDYRKGTVNFGVYKKYFGSNFYVHILIFLFTIFFIVGNATFDVGLGYWSNIDKNLVNNTITDTARQHYLISLSSIILFIITTSIISITSYYLLFVTCAEKFHNAIFEKIISSPLSFFHLNSSGRIINRFSKDLGLIDDYLHTVSIDTILLILTLLGVFIIKSIINYWFCVIMTTLAILFYFISKVYLPFIVAIKRLEGATKSPLYTHIKTTLEGLITIRAFKKEENYKKIFDDLQDVHTSAWFMYLSSVFTFRFLIDVLILLLTTIVTFSFFFIQGVQPGTIGLAITQSISLMSMVQWCVRQSCEVNVTMTSVERLSEYLELKSEVEMNKEVILKKTWPENGNIQFKNVSVNYVLNNVNFEIKSKDKVGIVGRTGAGKSSLYFALMRLMEFDGVIIIDDVDVKKVPLKTLRSKISVIPQDPIIFSGTLRKNLDIFQQLSDVFLWETLDKVGLKNIFSKFPSGLDTLISNNDLSLGEKQLICLIRAILLKNKILIMDEATANVDLEIEHLIHQIIKKTCNNSTVLIIAHRIQTVMDCDLIFVVNDGEIVEKGDPNSLLCKKGLFFEMLRKNKLH